MCRVTLPSNKGKSFATDMVIACSDVLGIRNRGIITEKQSERGRLAFVRKGGINTLQELFFITNPNGVPAYERSEYMLVKAHARIINQYDGGSILDLEIQNQIVYNVARLDILQFLGYMCSNRKGAAFGAFYYYFTGQRHTVLDAILIY